MFSEAAGASFSQSMSYVMGESQTFKTPETIPDLLKSLSERHAYKEAFVVYRSPTERRSISYGELYRKSLKFAAGLTSLGITKGQFIVICIPSSIDWLIAEYGTIMLGCIAAHATPNMRDLSDITSLISNTTAVAMVAPIADERTKNLLGNDMCSSLKYLITTDGQTAERIFSLEDIMNTAFEFKHNTIDADDPCILMRSSGTTGRSKLIVHSHRRIMNIMSTTTDAFGTTADDIRFSNCDFGWLGGTTFFELVKAGKCVHFSNHDFVADLKAFLVCMENEKCTWLLASSKLNNHLSLMKPLPNFPPSLRLVVTGSTAIKTEYNAFFEKIPTVACLYGCIEMGFMATKCVTSKKFIEKNGCGFVLGDIELKVVDDDGTLVAKDVPGNILVRTDNRFLYYMGDEERTRSVFNESNWYNTSDRCYVANNGEIFVVGRTIDTIYLDSIKYQPSEMEERVLSTEIPEIRDVMAVGIGDEIDGHKLCYLVIKSDDYDITEAEMKQLVCEKFELSSHYKPEYLLLVNKFAHNANGKLDRKIMTILAKEMIRITT